MGGCRKNSEPIPFVLPDVVSGGIILWHGTIATIPSGFVLCDGNNSTPDLRDKFIVGAKEDDGGVAKTNITGALTQSGGCVSHTHALTIPAISTPGFNEISVTDIAAADHLAPYYALAYIMKT